MTRGAGERPTRARVSRGTQPARAVKGKAGLGPRGARRPNAARARRAPARGDGEKEDRGPHRGSVGHGAAVVEGGDGDERGEEAGRRQRAKAQWMGAAVEARRGGAGPPRSSRVGGAWEEAGGGVRRGGGPAAAGVVRGAGCSRRRRWTLDPDWIGREGETRENVGNQGSG